MVINDLIKKLLIFGVVIISILYFSVQIIDARLMAIGKTFEVYKAKAVDGLVTVQRIEKNLNYISRCNRDIMLGNDYEGNLKKVQENILDIERHFYLLLKSVEDTENSEEKIKLILDAKQFTSDFVNDGLNKMISLGETDMSPKVRADMYKRYKKDATPLANKSREYFNKVKVMKKNHYKSLNKELDLEIDNLQSLVVYGLYVIVFFFIVNLFIVYASTRKNKEV